MNLVELATQSGPVFVNPAHVLTVRPASKPTGDAMPGKSALLLSDGSALEVDGEAGELARQIGAALCP